MRFVDELRVYLRTRNRENAVLAMSATEGAEDPFSRKTLPAHITGSAFVVDPERRKTLLIHHAALGIWIQPGGHVDPGELPVDAALRETWEETGIKARLLTTDILDVDIHPIPASAHKGEPAHHHIDVRYLVSADSESPVEVNQDECHGYGWLDLEVVAKQQNSVGRMAVMALAYLNDQAEKSA